MDVDDVMIVVAVVMVHHDDYVATVRMMFSSVEVEVAAEDYWASVAAVYQHHWAIVASYEEVAVVVLALLSSLLPIGREWSLQFSKCTAQEGF